ncbi:MAG: translation initiation factor IF-3, partial [Actinomycetota bacterium]|nr:translation initiation factor IF-3 [Actinomycetota bacterium]
MPGERSSGGVGATRVSQGAAGVPWPEDRERSRIAATTTNEPRINDRIRAREVRLVDPEGEQLGIKSLPDALGIARQLDLDLVEVAPSANPPVCRIMDYGKFKFDAAQRAKESKRKAVHVGIKEMKYRPKIGPGDFETKTRQVSKFLDEGHKVKVTIMFRGREVFHPELGKKILDRIAEEVDGVGKPEAVPRLDGRNMVMVLAPDKRAKQSAASRGDRGPAGEVPTGSGGRETENGAGAGPAAGVSGREVSGREVSVGGVVRSVGEADQQPVATGEARAA